MSLAIGKEGQNARLAYKLTDWRIDIKDPEALRLNGDDILRQARAAVDEAPDFLAWQGRQPRGVSEAGTIEVKGRTFGPLPEDLIRKSVDVDIRDTALEVYYNRELRMRYEFATGEELPLDDDMPMPAPVVPVEEDVPVLATGAAVEDD